MKKIKEINGNILINNLSNVKKCNKCNFLKSSDNSKCLCNVKTFDDKKLSKNTKEVKKIEPIAKISEKKKSEIKER